MGSSFEPTLETSFLRLKNDLMKGFLAQGLMAARMAFYEDPGAAKCKLAARITC